MDKGESRYKFKEADSLYRRRRYHEALALLEELDHAHPNTRRILYPLARTLARLDRHPQAIEVLDRIVQDSDYGPARDLKVKLEQLTASAIRLDLDKIDDELSSGLGFHSSMPPPLPEESRPSASVNLVLGVGLMLLLVTLVVLRGTVEVDFLEWLTNVNEQQDPLPPVPIGSMICFIIDLLLLGYIAGCMGAYSGLAVVQALPFTTFEDNLKDIAIYVAIGTLLSFVPVLGWLALLIIIYRHYELRLGTLMVVVFIYIVIIGAVSFGLTFFVGLASAMI